MLTLLPSQEVSYCHLCRYSVRIDQDNAQARDATWAFDGGLSNHPRVAKKRMQALRFAKYRE